MGRLAPRQCEEQSRSGCPTAAPRPTITLCSDRPFSRLFTETEWHQVTLLYGLTRRQAEVALLMCDGHTYKSIARETGISINTVRMHMRALFNKIGAHDRLSAVLQFVAAERATTGRTGPAPVAGI